MYAKRNTNTGDIQHGGADATASGSSTTVTVSGSTSGTRLGVAAYG